ncbi:MAG: hypothetical protein PHT91_02780, partial [Candidatus Nanoarchaeia archaeon]|nr:hypothetical protein [Candidatus Nanoarchaeia archaeon]
IPYNSRKLGEDLEVKILYGSGQVTQATSPGRVNTPPAGFVETPLPLNPVLKYYETSFEELESNMMGELNDTYFYSGNYSITGEGFPAFYPFEIEEIVNISFYSYIPSGDYTGYLGPFFVYFDIVSLEEPQEVYYEYLYMNVGAGNEGYFTFFYHEVGAPWPPMGPPEGYDELDFAIPYGEWFKIDIDVLNSNIRFNESEWQSINIDFSNANAIMLTEFFSDDFKIWYYSYD